MTSTLRAAFAAAMLTCAFSTSAFATGAIAVNDEQGMSADEAGYAVGYGTTKKEASANAVRECKSAGNEACKVMLTFEQCGAYVGDKVNYAIGIGATEKAAQKAALDECPNCKLVVSDCQ